MRLILSCLAAAGFCAAISLPAGARIERTVEKTFAVQPGGTLHVSTAGGDIRVVPSPDPVVRVTAREKIKAHSEAEADKVLERLALTLLQDGNDVTAKAEYEDPGVSFHFGSWPPVQVDFVVTVPARYSAQLRTSGGDIAVGDLEGEVRARTSGGNVKLGKISGAVEALTSGGDIHLGRAGGAADLKTSGGDIDVGAAGSALSARTSGGDVFAAFPGPLAGDCVLSTSGGEVKAVVSARAAFRLEAATSGGEVDARGLTLTIEHGGSRRNSLSGNVNGGGPLLRLHSSGGNIVIRTVQP